MKQRIVTALVLIPLVLGAVVYTNPVGIWIAAVLAGCIGAYEGALLIGGPLIRPIAGVAAVAWWQFCMAPVHQRYVLWVLVGVWLLAVIAVWIGLRRVSRLGKTVAGIGIGIWCAAPLAALVGIHNMGAATGVWNVASPMLLVLLPLWAGDTAAYFVGRAWGKHLFAPVISPKKTWEGAVANLLACVAVGVPVGEWIGYSWPIGLACGLAVGVFGQLGDLFESYVKRQAGKKDSGTLLPGHGGLLDRIDSLLFAAPIVALILSLWRA